MHSVKVLDVRKIYNVNILYVLHNNKLIFPVDPNMYLTIGDVAAIMCPDKDLNEAMNYFAGLNPKKSRNK